MSTLDKAGLLKAISLKTETISVDGGEIILSEITAVEYMDVYNSESVKNEKGEFDGTLFTSLLATRCIVDKKGKRLLEDADAEKLRNGSTAVYTKIAMAVKRLNGMGLEEKN